MGRRPTAAKHGDSLEHKDFRSLGKAIEGSFVGKRVDSYLASNYPFLTRAAWQKRLGKGQVRVGETTVHAAYKLKEGDVVTHFNPEENEPEVNSHIFPFWEEEGVMAVFKPSNLPMHEGGKYRKKTFCEFVKQEVGDDWAAVHRLDRDTSGLVLCANDTNIRNQLSKELRERTLEKTYLAIAQGVAKEDYWVEDGPLGMTGDTLWRDKRWVVPDGLPSQTEFSVVERAGNYTLLKVKPKTGRTHQIRIHAAINDLPLVGDTRYNRDENVFLEYMDGGFTDWVLRQIEVPRLCLHATALSFLHPVTEKRCDVAIPMPDDMRFIWEWIKSEKGFPIRSLSESHSLGFKNRFTLN
jgi:23S rRNA pseudouridine1911/1915/1917 synthase